MTDRKMRREAEITTQMIEAGHQSLAGAYLLITSAPDDFREIAKTVYEVMEEARRLSDH
jgi:hypothetical protein